MLEEAALDRYSFTRDAFLQRRRSVIYDGNPPDEVDEHLSPTRPEGGPAPSEAPTPVLPETSNNVGPAGSGEVKP